MYNTQGGYQQGFQGGVGMGGFGFQGGYGQPGFQSQPGMGGTGFQSQPGVGGTGFQSQPAGTGFQSQPAVGGTGFQSQPAMGGTGFQSQPAGTGFQSQPAGTGFQGGFGTQPYQNQGLSSGGFGAGMNIQGYNVPGGFPQQQPPAYGQPSPYGQQPGFGQQPPAYGQPPAFGQQPPAYGQPPAFGQQPAYGQPPAFGQPHPNSIYSKIGAPGSMGTLGAPQQGGFGQQIPLQQPQTFPHQPLQQQPIGGMVQTQPTPLGVVPRPLPVMNYNPEKDCDMLRQAMKGAGTDESTIINIIANRTNFQRQEIKKYYSTSYGKDLVKQLKSELSGHFEDVVIGLFQSPAEFDATCLYKAMKGIGTDESTLTEIIGTRVNWQIKDMKDAFQALYKKDLIKWVESETSGSYRKLLISLLQGNRSENQVPNVEQCQNDAQTLIRAGVGRWGTDEAMFNKIFALRSAAELKMISEIYEKQCGKTLLKSIDSEFSGDIKSLLKTVVKGLLYPGEYFAERIHDAVKGLGTNDKKLMRVIISRDEIDMPQIKDAYRRKYGRDMIGDIRGETSGDYRKILVALASH